MQFDFDITLDVASTVVSKFLLSFSGPIQNVEQHMGVQDNAILKKVLSTIYYSKYFLGIMEEKSQIKDLTLRSKRKFCKVLHEYFVISCTLILPVEKVGYCFWLIRSLLIP